MHLCFLDDLGQIGRELLRSVTSEICPSSVSIIGTSLGPNMDFLISESKKSPVEVKPLTRSPCLGSFLDAFSYHVGIHDNLSSYADKSFLSLRKDVLMSCFMDAACEAMIQSPQAKKHAFAGFDANGDIVACGINRFPTSEAAEIAGYEWGAHHAEFDLFSRSSSIGSIKFFVGVRVNRFREFRCSIPCHECADKFRLAEVPVFAIDWHGRIVRYRKDGNHEVICDFPGAIR